ncbi:MAG: class I SAM-dependent methyltransferase [Myxococcota bacterium]|nr:class I SAM-dependent methyltransferase [Myxococcota bacterium]
MPVETPEHQRLAEELSVTPWERAAITAAQLLFGLIARTLDCLLLVVRPRLLRAYGALWWAQVLASPYRWPRSFEAVRLVKQSGQTLRELMYGEAPVFSAVWLLWRAGVRRGSKVLDLGAGRGRVLLAARWLGADAGGMELRPEHVLPVQGVLQRVGARLEVADVLQADLGQPDLVFLNWCAFSPQTRARLTRRLEQLPPGTRVIAVAAPVESAGFRRQFRTWALMTWGPARVTLHQRAR